MLRSNLFVLFDIGQIICVSYQHHWHSSWNDNRKYENCNSIFLLQICEILFRSLFEFGCFINFPGNLFQMHGIYNASTPQWWWTEAKKIRSNIRQCMYAAQLNQFTFFLSYRYHLMCCYDCSQTYTHTQSVCRYCCFFFFFLFLAPFNIITIEWIGCRHSYYCGCYVIIHFF